ncbi:MAG: glycosyltransferase [Dehalococcoidia bacterium]
MRRKSHVRFCREAEPGDRLRLPIPDEVAILHVGTAAWQKNLSSVLGCVAELRRRGIPARLIRAGAPLPPPLLRLAADLEIAEYVTELGKPDDFGLKQVYGAADLLLYPSLKEGFGWPPLEALACGLPVVTSFDPALLELTGEAALHAPARDVSALADQCCRLLNDRELRQRLRVASIQRSHTYTWPRTAKAFAAVYARVLQATRNGRAAAS